MLHFFCIFALDFERKKSGPLAQLVRAADS